ncbi:MAG TPA: hypothetical protein VNA26_01060, partial [Chitinophagaceae bacterium]|nr:hypothetical protein [Chitinophagaceae bacterium]
KEARDLVDKGGAFSIYNAQDLSDLVKTLLADEIKLNDSGQAAKDYVLKNEGATERIVLYIQENRLLTN